MRKKNKNKVLILGLAAIAVGFFSFRIARSFDPNAKPIDSNRLRRSKYSKYAKWIEAMAKHESDNYTSSLSVEENNIFGMGYPTNRKASNNGLTEYKVEGQYMSSYLNRDQAIEDFILWLEDDGFPTDLDSIDEFVLELKNPRGIGSYFSDTVDNYTKGLKRWID